MKQHTAATTNDRERISLAEQYEPLAKAMVSRFIARFPINNANHDDELHQEARLALLECERRFDPSRGFSFATLARTIIRRQLIDYSEKITGIPIPRLEREKTGVFSVQFVPSADFMRSFHSACSHEDEICTRLTVAKLLRQLSRRDRYIVVEWQSRTSQEIADELGVSRQRIHQIYARSIKLLKKNRFKLAKSLNKPE